MIHVLAHAVKYDDENPQKASIKSYYTARMDDDADVQGHSNSPPPPFWQITRASLCHVAEHHPVRPASL